MIEIWKDILEYETLYQVSNLGNVRSLDRLVFNKGNQSFNKVLGKLLIPTLNNGYLAVSLCDKKSFRKTLRVHQLVAITFLNHIPCKYKRIVDHIDNNKLNNNLENLQIIEQRENSSKDKKGTIGANFRQKYNIWECRIVINDKLLYIGSFDTEKEASKKYQDALKAFKQNEPIKVYRKLITNKGKLALNVFEAMGVKLDLKKIKLNGYENRNRY